MMAGVDNDECACETEEHDGHTCPFAEDVNDDSETKYYCCPHCERECGMGI